MAITELILEFVLSKLMSKVFSRIDRKNMTAELLKGRFKISNIGLLSDLFVDLNLPIELEYSQVENVEVTIPWTSEQVILTINVTNIFALLVPKENFDISTIHMKQKEAVIHKILEEFFQKNKKIDQKGGEKNKSKLSSFFDKKLTDNVKINIDSIHLRYESEDKGYSFGTIIEKISCLTVDDKDKPFFYNREKCRKDFIRYMFKIQPLRIYFNSNERSFFYKNKDQEKKKMCSSFSNQENNKVPFNYILTVEIQGYINKYIKSKQNLFDFEAPEFQFQIDFKSIESKVNQEQYQDILDVVDYFLLFQGQWQYYVSKVEINPHKERSGDDIMSLISKKNKVGISEKEKLVVRKIVRNQMRWAFQTVYEDILKKKFFEEIMGQKISIEGIVTNTTLVKIIRKIQLQKIQEWVSTALQLQKRYEKQTNIFSQTKTNLKRFIGQYIGRKKDLRKKQEQEERREAKENKIVLKGKVNVLKTVCQVSKMNKFGITVQMTGFTLILLKRTTNFSINAGVDDLKVSIFQTQFNSEKQIYIPVVQKNILLQEDSSDFRKKLISLSFEKSPVGKPLVFSHSKISIQSIEVYLYLQALEKLYKLFFIDVPTKKKGNNTKRKFETKTKKNIDYDLKDNATLAALGYQHNIIEGNISSPWIIFPLSKINDKKRQCWVLRLGDLNIETPKEDFSANQMDSYLYYEQYYIKLQQFQFKSFSSLNFFHNWLRFNMKTETILSLPLYKNQKVIEIIHPVSCFVHLLFLKQNLSQLLKKNKEGLVAKIQISKIFISIPKMIMVKLQERLDLYNDQEQQEFLQTNVENILEQNQISGYAKIRNQKYSGMKVFLVLKGLYIYCFPKECQTLYLFFADIRETKIKLTSEYITLLNAEKQKFLFINFEGPNQHAQWKQNINFALNGVYKYRNVRKEKVITADSTKYERRNTKVDEEISKAVYQSKEREYKEEIDRISSENTKLSIKCEIQEMSIQLLDEQFLEFLFCNFNQALLSYQNQEQKLMKFNLREWFIHETVYEQVKKQFCSHSKHQFSSLYKEKEEEKSILRKKTHPFLGSKRFFQEDEESKKEEVQNFLELKVFHSDITGDLKDIQIEVDQLYISWKIQLFVKILGFFMYTQEADDVPTVSSTNKTEIKLFINMKRFYLYCYHQSVQLIALVKTHGIRITYDQSPSQEIFEVNCKKFEMDKCQDNNVHKKSPMIMCKDEWGQSLSRESFYKIKSGSSKSNPIYLYYAIRRRNTEKSKNITRLKKQFGEDLLVLELQCRWIDTIIIFQQQQTIRLVNYFLNKILGTVGAKFKKKEYSRNYIFQSLKINKMSTFDVDLTNFLVYMYPHERKNNFFEIPISKVKFSKNVRDDHEDFIPRPEKIQTKIQQMSVFYQNLVFDIQGVTPHYKFGSQKPVPMTDKPLDIFLTYGKLNFLREHEPILKSLSDIDRSITTHIRIFPKFQLQVQKIIFLTFLQIFYQNIKHRDGKADLFDPPHPVPALKKYRIHLEGIKLNLYEYEQNLFSRESMIEACPYMKIFSSYEVTDLVVDYEQIGQQSTIKIIGRNIQGDGQLPICPYKKSQESYLQMEMKSADGQMELKIYPKNCKLIVNLDKLNNIVEFFNYDSDSVANQIMPKKERESWQSINVLPKQCCLQMSELTLEGNFSVTYLKGLKNPLDPEIMQNLGFNNYNNPAALSKWLNELADKEIRVSGNKVRAFVKGKYIGHISQLYFNRIDVTSKKVQKRYKKQNVLLGNFCFVMTLKDLLQIKGVYEKDIKKNINWVGKLFLQPWYSMPEKVKMEEKRNTTAEIHKSLLHVISMKDTVLEPYLTVEMSLPRVGYHTRGNQQDIGMNLNLSIKQYNSNKSIVPVRVVSIRDFRFRYQTNKATGAKTYQIQNARNTKIHLKTFKEAALLQLLKERQHLSSPCPTYHPQINFRLINTTKLRVEVNMKSIRNGEEKGKKGERMCLMVEGEQSRSLGWDVFDMFNFWNSEMEMGFQVDQHGPVMVRKLNELRTSESTEIFSNLYITYEVHSPSVSLILHEGSTVFNHTDQVLFFWPFTHSKQPLSEPVKLPPQRATHIGVWERLEYIGVTSHSNRENCREYMHLSGRDKMHRCQLMRVGKQSKAHKHHVHIHYRYLVRNKLPVELEVNYRKIDPFDTGHVGVVDGGQELTCTVRGLGKHTLHMGSQSQWDISAKEGSLTYHIQVEKKPSKGDGEDVLTFRCTRLLKNNTYSQFMFSYNLQPQHNHINMHQYVCMPSQVHVLTFLNDYTYPNKKSHNIDLQQEQNLLWGRYSVEQIRQGGESLWVIEELLSVHNYSHVSITLFYNQLLVKQLLHDGHACIQMDKHQQLQVLATIPTGTLKSIVQLAPGSVCWQVDEVLLQVKVSRWNDRYSLQFREAATGYTIKNMLDGYLITIRQKQGIKVSPPPPKQPQYVGSKYKVHIAKQNVEVCNSIEHHIKPHEQKTIGLTNLAPPSILLVEFYLEKKNIDFQQRLTLECAHLPENPVVLELVEGEVEARVILFCQMKGNMWDCVVMMQSDYQQQLSNNCEEMNILVDEVELMVELQQESKDSVTLEASGIELRRVKKGKQARKQEWEVKVGKVLMREGHSRPIIQMLREHETVLHCSFLFQSTLKGRKVNNGSIDFRPLEFHFREGIIFKFLSRIVGMRKQFNRRQIRQKQSRAFRRREEIMTESVRKAEKEKEGLLQIDEMDVEEFKLFVSYIKDEYEANYSEFIGDPIIKYFVLMPGVSELKLTGPQIRIREFKGSRKELGKLFLKDLGHNIGGAIFSSISSLSLLDSPIAALDGITQYLSALFMINNP